jgi:RNA polymerase sigma-70 factor (ECF subfamily)
VRRTELASDLPDEALLAALATGDREAGVAFVRRWAPRVYGLAHGIVNDRGLAEDIAQEALLRCWRHAAVYDPRRGRVGTWVLTITRNIAIDTLRLQRPAPVDPEVIVGLFPPSAEPSPEDHALHHDALTSVRNALARLPADQRRAVLLAAYGGESAAEIAAREAIPLGTAKTRIRTGLLKVRAALAGTELP